MTYIIDSADGQETFRTLPVQGRFPDFRKVIPANFNTDFVLLSNELAEAVKSAVAIGTEEFRGADFEFSADDRLTIRAKSELGEVETSVDCATNGAVLKVTFDPRYILEFLESIPPATMIEWRMIDSDSAAILQADELNTRYVVMPLSRD